MARVLLAWELGGGAGHVLPLRWLADMLHARGDQVWVATRDTLRTAQCFAGSPHALVQAPAFAELRIVPQQMSSLADVIWFDAGGHTAPVCTLALQLWRTLLTDLQIDLLIADAAPMAVAAAQGVCPVLEWDVGFHVTDAAAWQIFRDWEPVNTVRVAERAATLLDHLNQARHRIGLEAAADLAGVFRADAVLVRQIPQLDARGTRPGVRHVPLFLGGGAPPEWPEPPGAPRIFVYVKSSYTQLERLLGALSRLADCAVLMVHDGIPPHRLPRVPHLHATDHMVDLAQTLPQCAVVVCHGGSLQSQALAAGVPTLGLPMHTEQFLQCRAAATSGSSLMLGPGDRPDFLSPLRRLLDAPQYRGLAGQLAAQANALGPDPVRPVLDTLDTLLAGARPLT